MDSTTAITLIRLGGIACLGWLLFHLFFWRLFDWKSQLPRLGFINRGVMQVLNLCLSFVFVIFAYLSLAHTREMISTPLGHALLASIGIFWLLRLAEQWIFFGRSFASNMFSLLFASMSALYLLSWLTA